MADLNAEMGSSDLCVAAASPFAQLEGWFVPTLGGDLHGLRARRGDRVFVARRKKMRPQVLADHPGRLDALFSGFAIEIRLKPGWNRFELQFKDGQKRWHGFAHCAVFLSPWWWLRLDWRKAQRTLPTESYPLWNKRCGDPSSDELRAMSKFLEAFPRRPLISIVMPVFNAEERWLNRAIESLRAQMYPHWELCIADDASRRPGIRPMLEAWARRDPRIKLTFLEQNGHICRASNAALEQCTGEFVALVDHDDELPGHALFHIAWEVVSHPQVDVVFSDEDKIDEEGNRTGPYFKPGWNYELLLGQNCVSHLGVYRTSLLRKIGGFREGFEGSQDWDLMLRASVECAPGTIRHVPRVLYHWRVLPTSAASGSDAKPYAREAGRRAVADHVGQTHSGADLLPVGGDGWRVRWPLADPLPRVSLVFAVPGSPPAFFHAVKMMRSQSRYLPMEFIAVGDAAELKNLQGLDDRQQQLRYVCCADISSRAEQCNLGARAARGEVLVFLDGSIEPSSEDWLRELVSQACRADVGAVGACLLAEDETILHAGLVLHLAGLVGRVFRKSPIDAPSSGGPPYLVREVTAVLDSALAIRRDVFHEAGGFNETDHPQVYHDVDLCLRLRSRGHRNIVTPFARLKYFHAGKQFRKFEPLTWNEVKQETERLVQCWPDAFTRDPFFNPNLSLDSEIPLLSTSRMTWPWQEDRPLSEIES